MMLHFLIFKAKILEILQESLSLDLWCYHEEAEQIEVSWWLSSCKIDNTVSQEPFVQLLKSAIWFLIKWFLLL